MTDYLTRVKKLLLSGQFDEALSLILITENDNSEVIRNEFEHQSLKIQVMIRKGDYEESIKEIRSILHKYPRDSLSYIDLSLFLIEATWRLGKLDSALEIGNEIELSLQEVQTSEADNLQRKAALHYHKGVIYRDLGDLDKSITFVNQSLILQQSNNLIQESAYTLNLLGIIYFQKGEYDKSLEYYTNSFEINKKIGDFQYIAKNLNNLGEIYRFQGNFVKSFDHYKAAHNLFLKLGNKQDILHTSHNIGLILHARGDFEGAKQNLLLSLEINNEIRNDNDKSDSLFHIISVFIDLGEFEVAKRYTAELNSLRHSHPQNKIISLRSLLANALILTETHQKEDTEKAKVILKKIVNEEIVFHELTVTALIHLCQILADELISNQEIDILSDLNTYTNQLQNLVDEQHSNALTIEIYILQSRFAIIKGKLQRALRSLEKAQEIAQKQKLNPLVMRIEEEIFNFHAEYEKWASLIQRNAPLHERLEDVRIAAYVKEAQRLVHLFN